MRIGIFSECYEPVQNGVTTSVQTLVSELRARQHRVVVVAPHYTAHVDDGPLVLRVPSIQTWLNKDYPVAYPWFPRLRREFGKLDPDVVHSHNPFFVGLLAARLAHHDGIPLVSTYHTLYTHYAHYLFFLPDAAVQAMLKWWIPDYYDRCAHVIVPSAVAAESLQQYKVRAPITVVPTAVPLAATDEISAEAQRVARSRWGIPHDVPLLLYVGRLAQEKNVEMVLDAFSTLTSDLGEARLLVVGGGPHLDALKRHAEQRAHADRVVFAGPVPHAELVPVYAAADLFVFASTTETQGLVIAEARAAGTPCVVVRGGGASETVRDGEDGVIVAPDSEAFTAAVRRVMRDSSLLGAMSEACRRNAHDYTPGAMTDRVADIYRHVVG